MRRLIAIVLGSAAGGGFPQWNCNCALCRLALAGDPRVRARSQTSLAVRIGRADWLLLNAAPDLRAQILATPALHPRNDQIRNSPIAAVLLTGAEIDQVAGLFSLRERQPFILLATADTLRTLEGNPLFGALDPAVVKRRVIAPGERLALGKIGAEIFSAPGKVPLFLEGGAPAIEESAVNIGVEVTNEDGRRLVFMPSVAALTEPLRERLRCADVILFDGTLFTDDEMIATGTGQKSGRRMGHMPITGEGGSLAELAGLSGRRIYIHINNTNPILREDSPERRRLDEVGIEVAWDGMEIVL